MSISSPENEGDMMDALTRLRKSLSKAPVMWKGDYPYFIHPITDGVPKLDPEVLSAVVELSSELVDWENIDLILGIEAMGLPLCAPLSIESSKPLLVARKRSYGLPGEITIDQTTGYSKGEMFLNDISEGERVLILDDVLSTGGTLRSVIDGVRRSGGIVSQIITVIEKGPGLANLQKEMPEIEFNSLVRLEMDGSKIIILD